MSSSSQTQKAWLTADPAFPSYPLHEQFRLMQSDMSAAKLTGRSVDVAIDQVSKLSVGHREAMENLLGKMTEAGEKNLTGAEQEQAMRKLGLLSPLPLTAEPEMKRGKSAMQNALNKLTSLGAKETKVIKKSAKAGEEKKKKEVKPAKVVKVPAKKEVEEEEEDDEPEESSSESEEDSTDSDDSDDDQSDDDGDDSADLSSLINDLAVALQYKGFSPSKIRELVKGHGAASLVRMLTAYIFCGNNFSDSLKKVEDKKVGMDLIRQFRKLKVKARRGEGGPETLVLSRVAIAHSPLLLIIRKKLDKQGQLPQSQFGTECPLVWQDLSLAGMPEKPEGYKEFYLKFGRALHKADPDADKKMTGEQVDEVSAGWIEKSENGYKADTAIHKIPTTRGSLNNAMKMLGY